MRYLLFISVLVLGVLSCDKEEIFDPFRDDIGNEAIRGRLLALQENGRIVTVSDEVVTLDYPNDSTDSSRPDSNFVFSQKTDAEGYFEFRFLKDSTVYRTSFYGYLFDGVLYSVDSLIYSGNDSVALLARIALQGQTGLQLLTVDSLSGTMLPKVTACFYTTSSALEAADSSCAGAAFALETDAGGRRSVYGVASGTYYVRSHYSVGDSVWSSEDVIQLAADSVVSSTIELSIYSSEQTATVDTTVSSVTFRTLDVNGDAVPQATVCLFTSEVLFTRDSSCTGANYEYVTDALGRRLVAGIPNGRYYVRGRYSINSTSVLLADTIATLEGPMPGSKTIPLYMR